jgi:hypothetical protein
VGVQRDPRVVGEPRVELGVFVGGELSSTTCGGTRGQALANLFEELDSSWSLILRMDTSPSSRKLATVLRRVWLTKPSIATW